MKSMIRMMQSHCTNYFPIVSGSKLQRENEITLIIVWSGRSGKAVCVEWILGVFVGVGVCRERKRGREREREILPPLLPLPLLPLPLPLPHLLLHPLLHLRRQHHLFHG